MAQAREEELIDYPVIRYVSDKDSFVDDHKYTSMECYLDIDLNGKRFTTSFCSPGDHVDLVIGILAQMGQIRTYDDIVRLDIDEENLQATVVTTEDAQAWAAQNATDPRYFRARESLDLALIHIPEPTRQAEISHAGFCLKKKIGHICIPSTPSPQSTEKPL